MQSLFILGRQPALGLAELESLFGAEALERISDNAVIVNVDPKDINFNRIGGSIKMAKVLTLLDYTDFNKLTGYISNTIPEHLGYIPEGKLKFGMSTFGLPIKVNDINRATLKIKKVIKHAGRSIRVVPNVDYTLNSAQVLYNQLTSQLGMELIFVRNGDKTILAQTVAEQDIDAYSARDYDRPHRDSKVGMLPPKLAQIIVNLSSGLETAGKTVLDPFCGTGVILQEAQMAGFEVYGTDLDDRMIQYTKSNIEWFQDKFHPLGQSWRAEKADATQYEWPFPFAAIACETYLGRPFSASPDPKILQEVMQDVNFIHKKFLQNVARQTEPGFRMCIAVPAWHVSGGIKHLKTLEILDELGYTRTRFVHARDEDMIYHRPGQTVARELVVLVRK